MGDRFEGDEELVAALRAGDERAFAQLLEDLDPMLRRVARRFVSSDAVAAEVVGDTWLAVIEGIDRFEGRSSLKTWIVRIVMNQARTRGVREARSIPFSSAASPGSDDPGGFDPDRFVRSASAGGGRPVGAWQRPPEDWETTPGARLESETTEAAILAAIDRLPEPRRAVVVLRDVLGWTSDEVCDALDLTAGNQRVLLHRGRSTVRRAIEAALEPGSSLGVGS